MPDIFTDLYNIVEKRNTERKEGSYTVYLIDAGLDKILKKLGEETAETIIAAKNLAKESGAGPVATKEAYEIDSDSALCEEREALKNEAADLLYHLTVMLYKLGVNPEEIETLLRARMQKTGNLKAFRQTDKDS